MGDWHEDSWIIGASEMAGEFFQNHRATMPEDPHDIWDDNEVGYFTFAFVLWSAQTKFKLKYGEQFLERVEQYRQNVRTCIKKSANGWEDDPDVSHMDYATCLNREKLYVPVLMKSSTRLLKALTGLTMEAACKAFIDLACKRFIFSQNNLIKIISPWLVGKNIEFQRDLEFD